MGENDMYSNSSAESTYLFRFFIYGILCFVCNNTWKVDEVRNERFYTIQQNNKQKKSVAFIV
jgi:hypothetical protein